MADIFSLPPLFDEAAVRERLTRITGVPAKLTPDMLYRAHQAMQTGLVPSGQRMTWDRFIRYSVAYRYRAFVAYLAQIETGHPLFGIKAVFDYHGCRRVDGRWCQKPEMQTRIGKISPDAYPKLFAEEAAMAEYARLPPPDVEFPMQHIFVATKDFAPPFRSAAALDDAIRLVADSVRLFLLEEILALLAPRATHGQSDRSAVRHKLWVLLKPIPAISLLVDGAAYPDAISRHVVSLVVKGEAAQLTGHGTKVDTKVDTKVETSVDTKVETKADPPRRAWFPPPPDRATRGIQPAPVEPKPEVKAEPKPEPKPEPQPEVVLEIPISPRYPKNLQRRTVRAEVRPFPIKVAWDALMDAIAPAIPKAFDAMDKLSNAELEATSKDAHLNPLLRDIAAQVLAARKSWQILDAPRRCEA